MRRAGEEGREGKGEKARKRGERWGGERERERVVERRRENRAGRKRERCELSDRRKSTSRRLCGVRQGEQGKGEGRRELDVRTNAICMILHVLARPGAAPIGFQLSAYVFCLLFWLYGMAGTRVVELEGWLGGGGRRGRRGGVKRRQRLSREIAASTRCERKLFCLVFLDVKTLVDGEREK